MDITNAGQGTMNRQRDFMAGARGPRDGSTPSGAGGLANDGHTNDTGARDARHRDLWSGYLNHRAPGSRPRSSMGPSLQIPHLLSCPINRVEERKNDAAAEHAPEVYRATHPDDTAPEAFCGPLPAAAPSLTRGGGGGGRRDEGGTRSPDNSGAVDADPRPGSACSGKICPQILATALPSPAAGDPAAAPKVLHVFARGSEGSLLRRSMTPAAAYTASDGPGARVEADWQAMGGPEGSSALFRSQPAAAAWRSAGGDQHVGVFAVSASGEAAATTWLASDSGSGTWSSWARFGGPVAGPLVACTGHDGEKGERADAFALATGAQGSLYSHTTATNDSATSMADWDQKLSRGYASSTSPAVVCRRRRPGRAPPYELLYQHKTAVTASWSAPSTVHPANFVEEPVAMAVADDGDDDGGRLMFFGISVNGQVWTSNWTSTGGWEHLRSIGDAGFQSVPVVINTGSTIEIVALGSNDRLQHRSLKNGQWSDAPVEAGGWEDLAVHGHGALQAVYIGGPDRLVALVVVGRGRQLNLTVFAIPDDGVWSRRAVWKSAGGNFSTSFMELRGAD
ncbi:hypothetical protein GGTG_04020 [Gaeumannomyces tritici R3-111a-1]|uniref:Fucose-specific lectin n=1 Tax=Gaeumannomyces tritici (strain R3-111a-1) TaxID=644352 RepID=J3NRX2_GAET3|nr:hypothetical protein GGTG_04020 [Gaeumannomyces tritici R3-111a-1]EJT78928.1 hypothetical protein GGTG_04020 [Gaeumannomyces tritici R3-111a-1]